MKILIAQSIPDVLEVIRMQISVAFPDIAENVIYESNFEDAIDVAPSGNLIVIASEYFHDDNHVYYKREDKYGSNLAREIKKKNPRARVYIYSSLTPLSLDYVDGYFHKGENAKEVYEEMSAILKKLLGKI